MEKIVRISDVIPDNQMKYGDAARLKVQIEKIVDNKLVKKDEYLDEKQTEKDINFYIDGLKDKRVNLYLKSGKKRLIYNLLMALISTAGFFTALGVGNILVNLGVNSILVGGISTFVIPIAITGAMMYVNKEIFYFSKEERDLLQEIKQEIARCDGITADIYKMKQEEKEFEYDYQRLNADFENTRNRNRQRNIDMKLEEQIRRRETDERIDASVKRKVKEMSKRNHSVNNVDFEYFKKFTESYQKPTLQKKSSFKEIRKDIQEFLKERINASKQEKYPENSFQRGERRRR